MTPVILSGGVGSRLWPLSRGMYPKQLLALAGSELSMLQQTVKRLDGVVDLAAPIIVCNEEHRFMVGEQVQKLKLAGATILLEPEGRNTAPAIALAALQLEPDEVIVVMPADHMIVNNDAFQKAIVDAEALARNQSLVTFGVVPRSPETGYGYIKAGDAQLAGFEVSEFKEKPDLATAREYLESGDYFWNSGIFMFTAQSYLSELKKLAPEVYDACVKAVQRIAPDLDFLRVDAESFSESPSISIDYAVMEKTDRAVVMPIDVGWSDVGSWSALWEVSDKDSDGNATHGDVVLHNTKNSHIHSQSKLVSAVGVEGLVIVETDDAVMVTTLEQSQQVKKIVNELERQGRSQPSHHRKVFRPWGWYDSVDVGEHFQVKRINVNPGASLSKQMHHHRAEHWVVVKGVAEILNGDTTSTLHENESTYIPIGQTHALRNPSDSESLEIIEVQTGSYLGEDDIVRFEDRYGRAKG